MPNPLKALKNRQKRRSARLMNKETRDLTRKFGQMSLEIEEDWSHSRLEVRVRDQKNAGVYALTDIPANQIIAEYRGATLYGRNAIEAAFQQAESENAEHFYIFEYRFKERRYGTVWKNVKKVVHFQ